MLTIEHNHNQITITTTFPIIIKPKAPQTTRLILRYTNHHKRITDNILHRTLSLHHDAIVTAAKKHKHKITTTTMTTTTTTAAGPLHRGQTRPHQRQDNTAVQR